MSDGQMFHGQMVNVLDSQLKIRKVNVQENFGNFRPFWVKYCMNTKSLNFDDHLSGNIKVSKASEV